MKCTDAGVLPSSDYYFATPSAMAKNLFYYLLCAGSYHCTADYHIKRESYNSVLLMYILEGSCMVRLQDHTDIARGGDIVLINCYKPHEYFANSALKTLWVHFDGSQSLEFAETILKNQGAVFTCENPNLFVQSLTAIVDIFRNHQNISEPSVSCLIHTMLCNLVSATSVSGALELEDNVVCTAIDYIKANYTFAIQIEDIAKHVAMSASHLSRLFKSQTGYSPYEYLLKVRLDKAKNMLKKTSLSIAQIAADTGFNSSSNFIYTFHAHMGISPNKFRNMPF